MTSSTSQPRIERTVDGLNEEEAKARCGHLTKLVDMYKG